MRHLHAYMVSLGLLLATACSNPGEGTKKYRTATGDGAMRAHLDDIDKKVANTRAGLSQMSLYRVDTVDYTVFSTGYTHWDAIEVYYNKAGLQSAMLIGSPKNGSRQEEFFFDKEGKLIFSRLRDEADSATTEPEVKEFYFILEKLVKVSNGRGEQLNPEKDSIKYQAIQMVNEAEQIRDLMAGKNLKP